MVWELSPNSTMREQFLRLGAYVKLVHVLCWNAKKSHSFNALNHHGGGIYGGSNYTSPAPTYFYFMFQRV